MSNPTVFLDIDNTVVITNSGKTFPTNPNDWKFNKDILDYIAVAIKKGFDVVFVSNQAGVINGYLRPNDAVARLDNILMNVRRFIFEETRTRCTFTLFAPMSSNNKYYKGPNVSKFAYQEATNYDAIRSIMIGDANSKETSFSDSDLVFANTLEIQTFYHPDDLFKQGLNKFRITLNTLLNK